MKNISVQTNDPKHSRLNLTIAGDVEKVVTISPNRVRLHGPLGQKIKASVDIIPEEKYPFKIVEVKAKNGKLISFNLSEVKRTNRIGYILNVENLKKDEGRYHDTIYLKTDSKIKPEIKIHVHGDIYEKRKRGKE